MRVVDAAVSPVQLLNRINDVESSNAPDTLYVTGDIDLLRSGRRIAVVGSRQASEFGLRRTRSVVKALVDRDIIVVSGLAEGIDTAAHRAAIEFDGRTIAVLGTPLDICYPLSNTELKQRIESQHAVVSQFAPGTPTTRRNFPMRNRTMALLTDATIVIEATESSGTKHQGWEGLRLGRDVLILQSVLGNQALSWPREMIEYGAQILTRENMATTFDNLPAYTDRINIDAIDI